MQLSLRNFLYVVNEHHSSNCLDFHKIAFFADQIVPFATDKHTDRQTDKQIHTYIHKEYFYSAYYPTVTDSMNCGR